MNIGMEMEQLPWGLYLIVREYSPTLSDKQILGKPQPANLNSRCLQEVVGSAAVGAGSPPLRCKWAILPVPLGHLACSEDPALFPADPRVPAGSGLVPLGLELS